MISTSHKRHKKTQKAQKGLLIHFVPYVLFVPFVAANPHMFEQRTVRLLLYELLIWRCLIPH